MKFKKGDTVIYPQHGACVVKGTKKMEAFGEKRDYLILETVINEMVLKVPVDKADEVGRASSGVSRRTRGLWCRCSRSPIRVCPPTGVAASRTIKRS